MIEPNRSWDVRKYPFGRYCRMLERLTQTHTRNAIIFKEGLKCGLTSRTQRNERPLAAPLTFPRNYGHKGQLCKFAEFGTTE